MKLRPALLLLLLAPGCTVRRVESAQCTFNEDCASPLICAGRYCRAQCSSDRDCPNGLCQPSTTEGTRVCLPVGAERLCASDSQCASGTRCAVDNTCRMVCASDNDCVGSGNGTSCLADAGVCANPVREPAPISVAPDVVAPDAAPDVAAPDAALDVAVMDAAPPDVAVKDAAPDDVVIQRPDAGVCDASFATDPMNCGACGVRCLVLPHTSATCASAHCGYACVSGYDDCNTLPADGCEQSLTDDSSNCGSCGFACMPGQVCVAGVCAMHAFPTTATTDFMPTSSTTLSYGRHDYRNIVIPAGVTITTVGTGVLELIAAGDVVINGRVDVSGGAGGAGLGDVCTRNAGAGGGGPTGTPTPGVAGDMVQCYPGGVGGLGGAGNPGGPGCGAAGNVGGGGAGGGGINAGSANGGGGGGGFAGGAGGGSSLLGDSSMAIAAAGGNGASPGGNTGGTGSGPGVAQCGGGGGEPGGGQYAGGNGASQAPGTSFCCAGGGGAIGHTAQLDLRVLSTSFQPGSGGGGGAGGMGNCGLGSSVGGGSGGGGGGGAVRIASMTSLTVGPTGSVLANGGNGGNAANNGGAGGGGGSGGVVYLAAPVMTLAGVVSAVGGRGGAGSSRCPSQGGAGGLGRVRLSMSPAHCVLSGTVTPGPVNACVPDAAPVSGFTYTAAYPD